MGPWGISAPVCLPILIRIFFCVWKFDDSFWRLARGFTLGATFFVGPGALCVLLIPRCQAWGHFFVGLSVPCVVFPHLRFYPSLLLFPCSRRAF